MSELPEYPRCQSCIDKLNAIARACHQTAQEKGWYEQKRNPLELIALVHSELSECVEAFREGNPKDRHLPEFDSVEIELADAIIRILDMSVHLGVDIGESVDAKMRFNKSRPKRHGGKAY